MPQHDFDVIIVGAGLSGVGAAYRLQNECPTKSYAILEARSASGGTWDLFRYPGIRSDSDMFTLAYPFRPWTGRKSIADGADIRQYIRDTATENGIDEHIRYEHSVTEARWSSENAQWTLTVTTPSGTQTLTAGFIYNCSGYYRYDEGYTPEFPGINDFTGMVVHPQHWPEDLDHAGKRIVVIGSGATAVTLIPSLAKTAAKVTMLQRSPSYISTLPSVDPTVTLMRRVLPDHMVHNVSRWKNALIAIGFYELCRHRPQQMRKILTRMVSRQLPKDLTVDPHFSPTYNPWDQRLCLVPDSDLFKAIRRGQATVVTDTIKTVTPDGIDLNSGEHLDADIIVTATGLNVRIGGGVTFYVDDTAIDPADHYLYRGLMLNDVPNAAFCIGYTNASWTLRADLSAKHVCKLLNYMDRKGYVSAAPHIDNANIPTRPAIDMQSGYLQRAAALMPKQGNKAPWQVRQNFLLDNFSAKTYNIATSMRFGSARAAVRPASPKPVEPAKV